MSGWMDNAVVGSIARQYNYSTGFSALAIEEKKMATTLENRAVADGQVYKPLGSLDQIEVKYMFDGNFTACIVLDQGKESVGIAKRAASLDNYNKETGKKVAFRSAVNHLLGVSNKYTRQHSSRKYYG